MATISNQLTYYPTTPSPHLFCKICKDPLLEDVIGHKRGTTQYLTHLIHESCLMKQFLLTNRPTCPFCNRIICKVPHFSIQEIFDSPAAVIQHDRQRLVARIEQLKEEKIKLFKKKQRTPQERNAFVVPLQLAGMRIREESDKNLKEWETMITEISRDNPSYPSLVRTALNLASAEMLTIKPRFYGKKRVLEQQSAVFYASMGAKKMKKSQ